MQNKIEQKEKKCWACKTILIEDGKLGLCPKCINKYGTPAAALALIPISIAGKQLMKNSGKIVKVAANVIKKLK
jgi:hypothetical protein